MQIRIGVCCDLCTSFHSVNKVHLRTISYAWKEVSEEGIKCDSLIQICP